jgi:hypothetical protein
MKKLILQLLTSAVLIGQPLTILLPSSPQCTGIKQSDINWPVFDVQVATKMSCTIEINQSGEYAISIIGFEPLTNAFTGMRVFDITVNGESKRIDYFKLSGVRTFYETSFTVHVFQRITISFDALSRTAVWSQIRIQQQNPQAVVVAGDTLMNVESIPLMATDSNTTKDYTLMSKPAGTSGLITILEDGTGLLKTSAQAAMIDQSLQISLPILQNGSKLTLIYWK